jgi:hypothetical protein
MPFLRGLINLKYYNTQKYLTHLVKVEEMASLSISITHNESLFVILLSPSQDFREGF